jgi:hypothetical protein
LITSKRNRIIEQGTLVLLFFFTWVACDKGELKPNAAPDTEISLQSINLTGDNRLNSTVNLTWFGTDIDGFISHYEVKINQGEWFRTQIQDSTFLFEIDPGEDSTDIDFFVRSVDNEGLADPQPAYLKVPLKNSPPEVFFETETLPLDTTNLVISFRYLASDPDGNNTLQKAFLRANEGDWQEIDLSKRLVSVIPQETEETGIGQADIYYGVEESSTISLNGFINGGDNILQLKVTDIANSESKVDSTTVIYVKEQTSDLLLIGGHNASITREYEQLASEAYGSFDAVNYAANGGLNQPRFWNPTFRLLALQYDKLFFHTNEATFSNPLTGADGILLDFAAPVIQQAIDNGSKVLVSTAFATGVDLTGISNTLSIDSLTGSRGQAFFTNDSFALPLQPDYLPLQPNNFLLATDPVYIAFEAEPLYSAQLTPNGGWYGPRTIALQRRNSNNRVNLVVFTIEYHNLNKLKDNQQQVLSKILNEEFNW